MIQFLGVKDLMFTRSNIWHLLFVLEFGYFLFIIQPCQLPQALIYTRGNLNHVFFPQIFNMKR